MPGTAGRTEQGCLEKAVYLVLLLYMCFAASFTAGKAALDYGPPFLLIAIRFTCAGLILFTYLFGFAHKRLSVRAQDVGLLAQIVLFHIMGAYLLEYWGMQYISSIKACFLYSLSPFMTAILAIIFLKDHISRKQGLGLFIGFLGFMPMLLTYESTEMVAGKGWLISIPEIALIISVLFSAYGWIVMKKLIDRGYTPFEVNGIGMLLGGLLSFPLAFMFEECHVIKPALNSVFTASLGAHGAGIALYLLNIGILVILANIIGYNLYGFSLRHYSATFISLAGVTTPLFAAIFGFLLLHEKITWHFGLSLIIVATGLYLYYQDELRKRGIRVD